MIVRQVAAVLVILTLALAAPGGAFSCPAQIQLDLRPSDPRPRGWWSCAERWVWAKTLRGEIADFNALYGIVLDPRAEDDKAWANTKTPRRLGERFLVDVLTMLEVADRRLHHGVRIEGAWLDKDVDLSGIVFDRPLRLETSRFAGKFSLEGATFGGLVSLNGSRFEERVLMTAMEVRGDLLLRNTVFLGEATLRSSRIDGLVDFTGANLNQTLDMENIHVKQSLFLSDKATFHGEVRLHFANIEGVIQMNDSQFDNNLIMEGTQVGHHVLLRWCATFNGEVNLSGLKAGGSVVTTEAIFEANVSLTGADVKALIIAGTAFQKGVLLTGANVDRLVLYPDDVSPHPCESDNDRLTTWGSPGLVLRDASIQIIEDSLHTVKDLEYNPWPPTQGLLHLDGLYYAGKGSFRTGRASPFTSWSIALDRRAPRAERSSDWYVEWLSRDAHYSRQAYQQLATIFRLAGENDKANDILHASRDRELWESWRKSNWPDFGRIGLLKLTIGYGIGPGYFWAVIWAALLTSLGAWLLRTSGNETARSKGLPWCWWASLDWMLPFVTLDENHSKTVIALTGARLHWFYFQALMGYVLAAFIAAGLAGLTQGA